MKRTTIYLPDDVHRALRREALERDLSMAQVIRQMSELYLKRDELFWQTVGTLRARNIQETFDEVEADVMKAVRTVRREKRGLRKAS